MYGRRAWLYDLIYAEKDYAGEANVLRDVLRQHGVHDGNAVLEAACGTGNFVEHLDQWYEVAGFDLSPAMLDIARKKVPHVDLFEADMVEVDVDREYDAVLCLFSSISYIETIDGLVAAAERFRRALRPGGVVVIEPWIGPEHFQAGRPSMKTYASDDLKICRQAVGKREGREATLDFHWLVARRDGEVEHFTDRLVAYLYGTREYRAAFEAAGLSVAYLDQGLCGRGLFVGVVP
jgi:daunosaminyl-N,N-dimethyltransferase/N-dimethyltransferase